MPWSAFVQVRGRERGSERERKREDKELEMELEYSDRIIFDYFDRNIFDKEWTKSGKQFGHVLVSLLCSAGLYFAIIRHYSCK